MDRDYSQGVLLLNSDGDSFSCCLRCPYQLFSEQSTRWCRWVTVWVPRSPEDRHCPLLHLRQTANRLSTILVLLYLDHWSSPFFLKVCWAGIKSSYSIIMVLVFSCSQGCCQAKRAWKFMLYRIAGNQFPWDCFPQCWKISPLRNHWKLMTRIILRPGFQTPEVPQK